MISYWSFVLPLSDTKQNTLRILIMKRRTEEGLLLGNSLSSASFVSRGATTFEIFQTGVSPVEADLGESSDLGRRIERSTDFRGASYPLESA